MKTPLEFKLHLLVAKLRPARFLLKLGVVLPLLAATLVGTEPRPILVINHYPNRIDRGVLDWDCPVFAAYSDGTTIWRRDWNRSLDAFATSCGKSSDHLVKRFRELTALYGGKIFTLTSSSDPDGTTIWCEGKVISIEGDWKKPRVLTTGNPEYAAAFALATQEEERLWAKLPPKLREALLELSSFNDPTAKSWRPTKLAVTLVPGGLGEPVEWPADWPRNFIPVPEQPGIVQAAFPGDMLEPLLNLLAKDSQPRAVLVSGKRMYGRIGFLFPQQSMWTESSVR